MKKLLAIMMALVMMLSACAFAEAATDFGGVEITLSDIVAFAGDDVLLDLTGLGLGFGVYGGEDAVGIQLALDAQAQEVLALNLAFAGEQLLLGMTGVSKVYSLDIATLMESMGLDADIMDELDMDQVTQQIQQIKPEDQMALLGLAMEAVAVAQAGVTTGISEEIDGVTYDVTSIEISEEAIQPLLEKAIAILDNYSYLLEDSGIESFSQLYAELTPTVGLSGSVLENGDFAAVDFTIRGSVLEGTQNGYVNLYIEGEEAVDGGVGLFVRATVGIGEESYSLTFNLDVMAENDGSWMPASDAPVDLMAALEDEAQSQQLMLEAMSVGMMALSRMAAANQTVAALMGSMMAG